MRPWGVFGEKERMCKKERGKKCCNGRERVKSVFEEVEWRVLLKPGGGVGGKGGKEELLKLRVIPIAIQSQSNRAPTAPTVPLLLA